MYVWYFWLQEEKNGRYYPFNIKAALWGLLYSFACTWGFRDHINKVKRPK